ncbi:MAG: hypothetical protein U0414_40730 [Polyangiaceae bacterium]
MDRLACLRRRRRRRRLTQDVRRTRTVRSLIGKARRMKVPAKNDETGEVTVSLDGNTAHLSAGGNGVPGAVVVSAEDGKARIKLVGGPEQTEAARVGPGGRRRVVQGGAPVFLDGVNCSLTLGDQERGGTLAIRDPVHGDAWLTASDLALGASGEGRARVALGASSSSLVLADASGRVRSQIDGLSGRITLHAADDDPAPRVTLDAQESTLLMIDDQGRRRAEVDGHHGRVVLRNEHSKDCVVLDNGAETDRAAGLFGCRGRAGFIGIFGKTTPDDRPWDRATITLDGYGAKLTLGAQGASGNVYMNDADKNLTVEIDAADAKLRTFRDGATTFELDGSKGDMTVGGRSRAGKVTMMNADGKATLVIDGGEGDIRLENGDCAEDFDVLTSGIEAGTVMVIGAAGKLEECTSQYDKKAAGVVSGAGSRRPAIRLGAGGASVGRCPVALTGTVFCKVDATESPVEVGDLLTTSATRGHAMKVSDPLRAFGAVLGKALEPLPNGKGLILILVALQ